MEKQSDTSSIRALFIDLDGTFLSSDKTISAENIRTLAACRKMGIHAFIATARIQSLALGIIRQSCDPQSIFSGGLFCNGAEIRWPAGTELDPVNPQVLATAIKTGIAHGSTNIALQLSGDRHAFLKPMSAVELAAWGIEKATTGGIIHFPVSGETPADVLKIMFFGDGAWSGGGEDLRPLHDTLTAEISGKASIYLTDNCRIIQVMGSGVSKKSGIERMMEILGLKAHEIAVFGDDVNDREMLSSFPHSVAMGNAPDEIKALARHVSRDNDHDGVAYAIRELLRPYITIPPSTVKTWPVI